MTVKLCFQLNLQRLSQVRTTQSHGAHLFTATELLFTQTCPFPFSITLPSFLPNQRTFLKQGLHFHLTGKTPRTRNAATRLVVSSRGSPGRVLARLTTRTSSDSAQVAMRDGSSETRMAVAQLRSERSVPTLSPSNSINRTESQEPLVWDLYF